MVSLVLQNLFAALMAGWLSQSGREATISLKAQRVTLCHPEGGAAEGASVAVAVGTHPGGV